MTARLTEAASEADFVQQGSRFLIATMGAAILEKGFSCIGLSGGSTPRAIYEALGREKSIDWSKVWIFLVDERYVPPDDPRSNQFLLRSTLLRNAPIPESQLIFPETKLPLEQCVSLYDAHLEDLFRKRLPDCVTLGLGEDGHIASLFPPLSQETFREKSAIATTTDRFDIHDRISVTLPSLCRARQALFLLKGANKRTVWDMMISDAGDEKRWPAKGILDAVPSTVITYA